MPSPSIAAAPPRLSVRGLECRRGERTLLRGLDFEVHPGQILWLRGANGQGKTTLLRTLSGLSEPDAGAIRWASADGPPFLHLGHANALKDDLSADESLRFLLDIERRPASPTMRREALARLGLAARLHAPVRTLSQGQRRRVALARLAIRPTPPVWLLDEPFDALDIAGIEVLGGLLADHARTGGSVVLSSHVPLDIADPLPVVLTLSPPQDA